MRRIKKIILWFCIVSVLFTLFGFFILPPILKLILVNKLSENLHRQVTIQKIKINPYALTLDVKGFLVKERGNADNFVYLEEVFVNLSSLSLAKRAVILEETRITRPYLKVVRQEDNSYNFSDLMEKPKSEPEKKSEPLRFSLNNITLSQGSVDFIDRPQNTNHTFRNLNLTIPSISNRPQDIDIFVQPKLSV
ncbi:MAG TPA: AsmA family protein, partial [Thermodesulfobacteriota bacterium]|nr:AsmA family protein [Thermodesulfobacteriota bacterium]